jgi:hypothetical protein
MHQRTVSIRDVALGDPYRDTSLYGPDEYTAEPFCTPALPDTRQAGMIEQPAVEAIARKPADRQVDLDLTYKPAMVRDTQR